jgi:hypothetical protein
MSNKYENFKVTFDSEGFPRLYSSDIDRFRDIAAADDRLFYLGLYMALKGTSPGIIENGLRGANLILASIPQVEFDFNNFNSLFPSASGFDLKKEYLSTEDSYKVSLIRLLGSVATNHCFVYRSFIRTMESLRDKQDIMKNEFNITTEMSHEEIEKKIEELSVYEGLTDWTAPDLVRNRVLEEFAEQLDKQSLSLEGEIMEWIEVQGEE